MKKITTLFAGIFIAISSLFSTDINLSFDSIATKAGFAFTVSKSSQYPQRFVIENTDNWNMYRLFAAEFDGNGPILANYSGLLIEFDYAKAMEIPAELQFFFSTDGFNRGYYPLVSTLITDPEAPATLNLPFDPILYPNLFVTAAGEPVAADKRFNRFGFRSTKPKQNAGAEDYIMEVKLKSVALITKEGTNEYFNIAGGGVWNAGHSYRLYGQSASFTLGAEGFAAWDLSTKTVKYINIYLDQALTVDDISKLSFESNEFVTIDNSLITGLAEGSKFISIDARNLTIGNFAFLSLPGGIELFVNRIALSDSPEQASSLSKTFNNDQMPAFVTVYNINGQVVKLNVARESALENLEKGIYIINKKKIAITE